MVINSFSFSLSVNVLISPSFLKDSFASYRTLGWWVFSFSTLNIYSVAFLSVGFLLRNMLIILLRIPWMWWVVFLLLLSRFSVFDFPQFNYIMSQCGFSLLGVHWAYSIVCPCLSSNWGIFQPQVFLQISFLPLTPFFPCSPPGMSIVHMLVQIMVSQKSLGSADFSSFFSLFGPQIW